MFLVHLVACNLSEFWYFVEFTYKYYSTNAALTVNNIFNSFWILACISSYIFRCEYGLDAVLALYMISKFMSTLGYPGYIDLELPSFDAPLIS